MLDEKNLKNKASAKHSN